MPPKRLNNGKEDQADFPDTSRATQKCSPRDSGFLGNLAPLRKAIREITPSRLTGRDSKIPLRHSSFSSEDLIINELLICGRG